MTTPDGIARCRVTNGDHTGAIINSAPEVRADEQSELHMRPFVSFSDQESAFRQLLCSLHLYAPVLTSCRRRVTHASALCGMRSYARVRRISHGSTTRNAPRKRFRYLAYMIIYGLHVSLRAFRAAARSNVERICTVDGGPGTCTHIVGDSGPVPNHVFSNTTFPSAHQCPVSV